MMVTLLCASAYAEARPSSGAELLRALDRINVVGNVLYVAAHPDDENTRLLAYLANDKLVRAGYLSLTRGEGGQNLIGRELAPLLGLIRTEELLQARAIDGAEQWFTRARDFGYSKTPDETLAIWDHDAILADVVRVIRRFRPDVIVTRFLPDGGETHGHHTASAMLAVEAWKAAGDAARFAELGAPWQAKRVVWNRYNFGNMPAPSADEQRALTRLDVGGYNPVLGLSYGEIAAASRTMHKSQGFGVPPSRGESFEFFRTLAGEAAKTSPLDGVDLTWGRVAGGKAVAAHLGRIRAAFSVEAPYKSVPELVALYGEMAALGEHPWKAQKLDELAALILGCAGFWADAVVADHVATPGSEVALTVSAINRSPLMVTLRELKLPGGERVAVDKALPNDKPLRLERALKLPTEIEHTQPYWLAEPPEKGHFVVRDAALIGLPAAPAPSLELAVAFADGKGGARTLTVTRPLVYKWTDPVAGERTRALEILPAVSVNPRVDLLVFADTAPKPITVLVKANRDNAAGELGPELPPGFAAEPRAQAFSLAKKGAEVELSFRIRPPAAAAQTSLRFVATVGGEKIARAVTHVEYAHIPIATVTPSSEVKLVRVDVRHKKTRIGYIAGAGDEVPRALGQIGYQVTMLDEDAIAHGALSQYQTIITGVRAYNVDRRLPFLHDRLMKYVADGGTLLVQYNTSNFISKAPAEIGPSPFHISQERVTDENAAVTLLDRGHAIVSRPNPIGERDFAGWIQERGLYFADQWDAAYHPLLSMHDKGEPERKGSLLVAKHGKGAFIYTGLSFFRQLPAGVPGAYRLFANLIDYGP